MDSGFRILIVAHNRWRRRSSASSTTSCWWRRMEPVALAPSASAEVPCSLDRTLGSMREEAATIGMELYPLTTVAEVAALVASALLYPSGTPFRASKMRTKLRI